MVSSVALAGQNSPLGAGASLIFNGGALEYTGSDATPATNRAVTLNSGGGTFQVDNVATNLTIEGVVSGPGSLTKAGPGTLSLSGNNTYTGGTTLIGGILAFADGGLRSNGDIAFANRRATLVYAPGNTQDISARLKNSTGRLSSTTTDNGSLSVARSTTQ